MAGQAAKERRELEAGQAGSTQEKAGEGQEKEDSSQKGEERGRRVFQKDNDYREAMGRREARRKPPTPTPPAPERWRPRPGVVSRLPSPLSSL